MKRNVSMFWFLAFIVGIFLMPGLIYPQPIYKALNPRGIAPEIKSTPLATRLATLKNKVIYNINIGKPAADLLCPELEKALKEAIPDVKVVYKKKQLSFLQDEPDLWKEVTEKGDGAIISIAD